MKGRSIHKRIVYISIKYLVSCSFCAGRQGLVAYMKGRVGSGSLFAGSTGRVARGSSGRMSLFFF